MNLLSIILISTLSLISGQDYELICELKNTRDGVFSSSITTTGLENADDPTSNTYCIIGNFNNDDDLKNAYRGDDGKFGFKLTYTYNDQTTDTLIWRQTSWCADPKVVGAEFTDIPDQSGKQTAAQFHGLAISSRTETYLDGTGNDHSWWFHSVGTTSLGWNNGIPGDRTGEAAYTSSLYVLMPDPCTGVTCAADLICDAGECVRNCAVLDIDGFLTDCSSEFDSTTGDITQLQSDLNAAEGRITANEAAITALGQEDGAINTRIDGLDTRVGANEGAITGLGTRLTTAEGNINDNDADIAGLDGRLTTAEGDINTNEGRIGDAEGDISDLQGDIARIDGVLDALSAQSAGSNFDANRNYNDYDTDNKSPLITTETKDLLILFLLALNMVSLCVMCTIWMRSRDKYSKYDKVRGYETEENIQLNH